MNNEFIPKFKLQLFSEENAEGAIVEDEMEGDLSDLTEDDIDSSEENSFSLDYQYNGEEGVITDIEEARNYAQKGMNYDKIYTQNEEYKSKMENMIEKDNKLYAWASKYMKDTGYETEEDFLKAIDIDNTKRNYIKNGMDEASASQRAELDYRLKSLETQLSAKEAENKEIKEIEDFLNWHQSKVSDGIYDEAITADGIPPEVWQAVESGTPLKTAFMEHSLKDFKTNAEQNVINKIDENKRTSTGSVKEGAQNQVETSWTNEYIDKMMDTHGEAWIEENFDKIEASGYFKKY